MMTVRKTKGVSPLCCQNVLPDAATIYSSLPAQLAYPVGSLERIAIQNAYAYGQARKFAADAGAFGLSFIILKDLLIENIND